MMKPRRRLPPGVLNEDDLKDIEDEDYHALRDLVEKELKEEPDDKPGTRRSS